MSDDLLIKEKEFHRLNRELELKTCNVMKEVSSIIHARVSNGLLDDTNQSYQSSTMKEVKATRPENVTLKINKQLGESLVPETLLGENLGNAEITLKKDNSLENKTVINLMKSKIDMLHRELQTMQLEYNRKCEYSKELEVENKKLEEARVKLHNQIGFLNDTIAKLEGTNSDTLSKYQALSNENIALKKNLDGLKKEIKVLNQQSTNYDVRLNRSLESNEKLRNTLKCNQMEEKELRSQIRKLQEEKRLAIKNLEKKRSELVQAFKKQTLLIDNLKKQNLYLMANGQIRLKEDDFAKLMEWKP